MPLSGLFTNDSGLGGVFAKTTWPLNQFNPEIADWNQLKVNEHTWLGTSVKIGLFGYDMIPLRKECKEADLGICDIIDALDGWSIGVEIIIDEEQYSPYVYGACFSASHTCVVFNPSAAHQKAYYIGSYQYN